MFSVAKKTISTAMRIPEEAQYKAISVILTET
jgi:hypothetical protein